MGSERPQPTVHAKFTWVSIQKMQWAWQIDASRVQTRHPRPNGIRDVFADINNYSGQHTSRHWSRAHPLDESRRVEIPRVQPESGAVAMIEAVDRAVATIDRQETFRLVGVSGSHNGRVTCRTKIIVHAENPSAHSFPISKQIPGMVYPTLNQVYRSGAW